jgi:hypothetical protein
MDRMAWMSYPYRSPIPEALESRIVFAGPTLVAMHFTGTEQEVTSVVLTFSDRLDPASAQNPNAYFVGRNTPGTKDAFWDPLDLNDNSPQADRIPMRTAVYDDASQTVTLTPATAFNVMDRLRRIRVSGRGASAVKDVAGVAFDGNRDGVPGGSGVMRLRVQATKNVVFRDADGDRARVRLSGPGKIVSITATRRQTAPILFLNRTNALKSGVIGSVVRNRRTGDGVATIRQISGTGFATVGILTSPLFRIEIVNP